MRTENRSIVNLGQSEISLLKSILERSVNITRILMRLPHEILNPLENALKVPTLDTLYECHFNTDLLN